MLARWPAGGIMHKLRSPVGRRGIGVHLVRAAAFSAALLAITGIVVADVIAAEPEEPVVARIAAEPGSADAEAPVLLAAAVVVPDAVVVAAQGLPEDLAPPEPPKKKKRSSKIKFGRFEGY
jgi:hypothetical protein